MRKICGNCQYFRESEWCSNSERPALANFIALIAQYNYYQAVNKDWTCSEFYQRGKKAPWWMRFINWILQIKE